MLKKFIEAFDVVDFFLFGGLILLGVGIGLIHVPASLVAVGLMMILLGVRAIPKQEDGDD